MGKRTTTRHKEDNTFRFQTFEEKLRQISVNVNLSIRDGRAEELGEKDTYFSQEVEKWVDLNRTETFADLLCKIGTDCRTLTQLVLQKDRVAKELLEHLECSQNVASYEPAFALSIALARDLGEEFYPHFENFVKVIIKIVMESKNTNIIEAGFKCYAYLSKYLRRQILKDLQQHMKLFSCFMNPKLKTYVMIFACESFSIVSGKFARDHPEAFLKLVYGIFLRKHPEHSIGVATLLFSIFKGVAGTLKLEGPGMHFKDCISFLYTLENPDEMSVWTEVLSNLSTRLLNHGNPANSERLVTLIETLLIENLEENRDISNLLSVYKAVIEFNNAGKITNIANCSQALQKVIRVSNVDNYQLLCRMVIHLIESKCSLVDTEVLNVLQPAITGLLENPNVSFEMLESLDKTLRGFRAYFRMFLEPIMEAYSHTTNPSYVTCSRDMTVYCLSEAILQQGGLYNFPNTSDHYFSGINSPMVYFQFPKPIITILNVNNIKGITWDCCSLLEEAENDFNCDADENRHDYYTRLFFVFSRLNSRNCEACIKRCIGSLDRFLLLDQLNDNMLAAINYLLHVFVTQTSLITSLYDQIPVKKLLSQLIRRTKAVSISSEKFSIWSLKVLDVTIYFLKVTGSEKCIAALKDFVRQSWNTLADNLMSGFRMVRALTLSILRNTIAFSESATDKTIEMLVKFLELEDMSLSNTKYSSLAKSILTECKVIVGSDNYDLELKLLVLKYTLGLMYTNYNLIWSPCIEVIRQAGKHIDMKSYWPVFGAHFCDNQNYSEKRSSNPQIRLSILPISAEKDTPCFLDSLSITTFGLPNSDSGYTGPEEQLDLVQYKTNLWLSLRGQPLTRKEYGEIKEYVETLIGGPKGGSLEDETKLSVREQSKMIIPLLQFLESCDLVNVNHELWEAALKYLTYAPDVQKAAWKFLYAKRKNKLKNYKEDIDEVLNSDSMDPFHKFRVDAVDVSLSKQYENETLERRNLLMEILIRVLIGKERVMKGEKRLQVLRFLAGCNEPDAQKYLSLTVGSTEEVQRLPPKIIEIKINKMTSVVRTWRYKFPAILDQLVNNACDLATAIGSSTKPLTRRSLNPDEEVPDEVFEEQKKAALKAGRLCIVTFFSSLPRLDMKSETIDKIFEVFIWPALTDITVTSVGSVSWILRLFLVWSIHERYHVLLTKCKDNDVFQSPMWRLFDLLESKSAVFEVKKYVLGIIFNLMDPPELREESEEQEEESYLNCSNSPLNVAGTYVFETTESVGVNIILLRREVVLTLFQDSQAFKKLTTQSGGGKCLSLISLLAGYAAGGEMNEKLCSVIMETFSMCKNNEEVLFNSINAVGKLMSSVTSPLELLMKIAPNFSWISGRRLRLALVDTLSVIQQTDLYEIVNGMNAWMDMADDTPNFSKRQESFERAEKVLQNGEFDLLSYTLIFYNAVYCISKEEDIGIRNSSKNLLVLMASCLKEKIKAEDSITKGEVHKLLDSVILPKLRNRIQEKDDKRHEDILRVLLAFIVSCNELHGTLKALAKLLTDDIIDGLCDIQVHLRTRAMNRLSKKLKENADPISPAVLQAFILPITTHYLFDEDRLSKNYNELIDSSIEVLKAVMSVTSHEQYFSYLGKLLDDTKKKTKLAKQFERVLIAIMDAFHFDLSLACPENGNSNAGDKSLSQDLPIENVQLEDEATLNGESDDETQKEEFNITKESVQVQMAITLVPQTAAVRCLGILKSSIIPKLRKFLNFEETATHKLSRSSKTVDNDVILKIPCTIALVKLLKKIPKAEGQNGIRSIIPSITAGLRNELVSIRNTLRKTLLSVIKELGTSHLKVVIGYLKSSLQRGYQRHVLNYTVAYLLRCLETELRANPSHVPVKEVLTLCEDELYGIMQEEKELAVIKQKTREASKSNAYPILKVCAKCVSGIEQLNSLIDPAVKHLLEKKSMKVAKASRQWLVSISEGLAENGTTNCYELLEWLLNVLKKDDMRENPDKGINEEGEPLNKKRKLLEAPVDSKIIPTLKKKIVIEGKVGEQSLLKEFTYTCLYSNLNKSGRFRERLKEKDALNVLDQFVPSLADGIKAPSKQVNIIALRCITSLLEFELTNFKKPEIIDKLQQNGFIAMSNHCYRNTTDAEITNATFKFLSAFFVRFPDFKIVLQDFELMLKCVQGYLTDGNCSSSALTLLKGVLQNKYRCSALPDLMQEVFKQCITSYYQHINEGCRQVYLTYLNNYLTDPKDLYLEVQLILRQLDYEHDSGRLTATEILNSLLQNIPQDCFEEIKELVFLKILATLDREKFPKVRERLGESIKLLFKLEKGKSLARILLKLLLLDKHIPELDTFFLIIGLVIEDPNVFSNNDISIIIKRIKQVLDPKSLKEMCVNNVRITIQIKDYMIFQAMVAFKKALNRSAFELPLWSTSSPLAEDIGPIFDSLRETYLMYEHEWVPLITIDIISLVLNKLQLTDEDKKIQVAKNIEVGKPICVFLSNAENLQLLLSKIWVAMKRSEREDVLAKGAYTLVLLISVAARFKDKDIFIESISHIRRSVNGEVVKNPRITTIRSVALGCFRGIAKTCPRDAVEHVVEIMTRVAVRELTDDNVPQDIKNECEKLISVLRDVIGSSAFNVIHAKCNDFLHKKRNLNRAKKKETAVCHPGLVRKRPKKVNTSFKGNKKKRTK